MNTMMGITVPHPQSRTAFRPPLLTWRLCHRDENGCDGCWALIVPLYDIESNRGEDAGVQVDAANLGPTSELYPYKNDKNSQDIEA